MENVIAENAATAPEVVAPEVTETNAVSVSAENAGAVAKPKQSVEENRAYAAMRREMESAKEELERHKAEVGKLFSTLNAEGYVGTDALSLSDSIIAAKEGISPEQVKARRENEAQAIRDAVQRDPEYLRNKREAEQFREMLYRRQVESDIAELNSKYGVELKSAEDLGEQYHKLRAAGIDNDTAFLATIGKGKIAASTATPEIGAANGGKATPEKEYYSEEELGKLSQKELMNDDVWEKAMRSMHRHKK